MSPEPLMQPCMVCCPEEAPVEVWSLLAVPVEVEGFDCVEEGC